MRVLVMVAVAAGLLGGPAGAQAQEEPDRAQIQRGIQVYAEQRCQACHSIDGVGNRRYPLDGVGSRLTREEIRTWIVAPREMDSRVRKRPYDRLSQEELDGLIAYMMSLTDN